MFMSMNAHEQNQRDTKHRWGCNKGNEETTEKPNQENKSLVDQKTRLIQDGKKVKGNTNFYRRQNYQRSLKVERGKNNNTDVH